MPNVGGHPRVEAGGCNELDEPALFGELSFIFGYLNKIFSMVARVQLTG